MTIAATMFSGIGAPECSMPHWEWRWCAEIEKFPSAVLAARHPATVNLGDINAEDFVERAEKAGRPDVIVFGSPCQDFSVAGRRVGLDGDRGNLALVALGIVNRLRPRWVVFENVPGLLSSYSGCPDEACPADPGGTIEGDEDSDFAAFLALVQQCGYLGCYRITDAQYAGVPQRRRRIFAVFHIGDWRPAAAVLFEPEGLRGDHPPRREAGKGIAPTISARPTDGGGDDLAKSLKTNTGGIDREDGHALIVGTLGQRTCDHPSGIKSESDFIVPVADGPVGAVSSKWSKGSGGPAGDECYNLVAFNGRPDPDVYGDRTGPLDTDPGTQVVAFTSKDYGGDAAIDQSPTLRAMEFDGSHANGGGQVAIAYALGSHSGTADGDQTNRSHAKGGPVGSGISEDQAYALRGGRTQAVAFQTRIARNGRGSETDVVPALNGADAGATSDMRPCVAVFKPSHFTRGKYGAPSGVLPPLGAEPDKGDQDAVLMTGTAVRRLTPRECERLQAFPDDYTLIQYRGNDAADGPRYKALGNAMNVNEVRWVLQRIEQFEMTVV